MTSLFARLAARFQPPPRLDDRLWQRALQRSRLQSRLPADRAARLRALTERFLHGKAITPAAGFISNAERDALIATLCCLPVLELGFDWLRGWSQVIVYPGQFRVRRERHDEDTGVVDEWDDELAGESWDRGPLVLSWADIAQDLRDPQPGYQVVVHEIAHKLDALDGAMDGTPPLPDRGRRQAWVAAFQTAFDRLGAAFDAGEELPIDPYALEGPDEFFAVVSEYHYSAPGLLAAALPAVAAELEAFYGRSPFADG